MNAPVWLTQRRTDVPPDDGWLTPSEQRVLAGLRIEPRRAAWRLGRWTAKAAIGFSLGVAPETVEVLAASDGAPEAWLNRTRLPVSISLSHRAGRALAVVAAAPAVAGCDLELVEPRSGAFVREWLTPAEQRRVRDARDDRRAQVANLIWTAKEAAAKVRRQGLRLDLRRAQVTLSEPDAGAGEWSAFCVEWDDDAAPTAGWWRWEPGWVMSFAGDPAPGRPSLLSQVTD